MPNFPQSLDLKLLILGDQNLLKGKEIVTQEYLLKDLAIPLTFDTFNDAFF